MQLKRNLKKKLKMKLKVSCKQRKQIQMTNMSIGYFILGKKSIKSFKQIIKTYNRNWSVWLKFYDLFKNKVPLKPSHKLSKWMYMTTKQLKNNQNKTQTNGQNHT